MLTILKTKILKLFCISTLIIITCLYANSATASTENIPATYYVATNGNDRNPGTIAKPWRTITYAADNSIVKPGDTILIRNGTYNELIKQQISGSQNGLLTYKNYPGEVVIISDQGSSSSPSRWLIKDQSYIRIEGLTFQNNLRGAIEVRTKERDMSNIYIINNRIINQGSGNNNDEDLAKTMHITTLDTKLNLKNIYVIGNYFENINNGERPTLHITGQVQNAIVQNNTFSGTSFIALGISGQPTMGQPKNIIIKNNHISGHVWLGGPHSGIYLNGAGSNILIEENTVHDGTQGIKVNLEPVNKNLTTKNIIIRRNVIYNHTSMNLKLGTGAASDECSQIGKLEDSVAVHNTVSDGNTNHWFSCGTNLRWKNNIYTKTDSDNGFQYRLDNASVDTSTWTLNHNFFSHPNLNKPFKWNSKHYSTLNDFISATGYESSAIWGSPEFKDMNNGNYELTAGSGARNAGTWLTTTRYAGNGTLIDVYDSTYFTNGFGLQQGDIVRVGQEEVIVVDVNYNSHTLKVNRAISWNKDTPVSYAYAENKPDVGAFEYSPTLNFFAIPQDMKINLHWNSTIDLPDNTQWEITYQPTNTSTANTPTIILPLNNNSYSITNIPNYELYTITLKATADNEVIISKTIESFATDIFTFLPIVNK